MSDFVSPLLEWLNANPQLAGLATFIISAAESIAIIGTVVPGSVTMTAIGTLAGAGVIPLWETIIWAILGAIVGDGISYWIGHYFKDRLRMMWPFRTNPQVLEKGEVFVHKYGVMSVFVGRFVGPVRALVPLVAGMLGMKPLQFTIANVASAIGWAPAYMLPGILLGAASLELPADIALHVILVLFLIVLFVILCVWVIYKVLQLINQQTETMLIRWWNYLNKSRHFSKATTILRHSDPKQLHGQLTLAFYLLLTSLLFFWVVIYVKIVGPENIFINEAMLHLFRGIRTAAIDNIMLAITFFGQKQILVPMVLALFAWLIYKKHTRVALHILGLIILTGISIFFFKHLLHSLRPEGIFQSPETFSMPSGHATLATTVYLGIAFFIANSLPKKWRWLVYTPAVMIVLAVSISRMYLGAHWFTDIFSAWLLAAALLMLMILSFHRQHAKPVKILGISLICFASLMLSYGIFYYREFNQLKINYAQLDLPIKKIALKEWWEKDALIPSERVSLFGIPTQIINLQWAANLPEIKKSLLKAGWEIPSERNWITILHRITNIQSSEYLPLVSPQYLDKKPMLIMIRRINEKKLLVLRLWESSRIIEETNTPLWVGTVGIIPTSYAWIFRKNRDIEINPKVLFPLAGKQPWQLRTIKITLPHANKTIVQTILLVREKQITY